MKSNRASRKEQILPAIGFILVTVGLICNGWLVPRLMPSEQVYEFAEDRLRIWVFDLCLILSGFLLIRLRSKAKILLDAFVGIVLTALLLVGIEGLFYLVNNRWQQQDLVWYEGGDIYQADDILGYKPQANARINSVMKRNGKIVYDAFYSTDPYHRRITPMQNPDNRAHYLLFFGDSFTFGHGVSDDETMPFYVAKLAPDYYPYNYGFSGYGPQMMLARLQNRPLRPEIAQAHGIAIYTFLDSHVERTIGSMNIYNQWGRVMPYYAFDAHHNLVRRGDFTTGRPALSSLYIIIGKSQTARFFNVNLPPRINQAHIRLTAKVIEESHHLYAQQFDGDDFYVLFYPGWSTRAQQIIPHLERAGIKYLDYSDLFDRSQTELWIQGDSHPTPAGYRLVAARLVQDLNIGSAGRPEAR